MSVLLVVGRSFRFGTAGARTHPGIAPADGTPPAAGVELPYMSQDLPRTAGRPNLSVPPARILNVTDLSDPRVASSLATRVPDPTGGESGQESAGAVAGFVICRWDRAVERALGNSYASPPRAEPGRMSEGQVHPKSLLIMPFVVVHAGDPRGRVQADSERQAGQAVGLIGVNWDASAQSGATSGHGPLRRRDGGDPASGSPVTPGGRRE